MRRGDRGCPALERGTAGSGGLGPRPSRRCHSGTDRERGAAHHLHFASTSGRRGKQVLAANVGLITIVMGLDGDHNRRRLERYLVQAAASGAEALVALNKMDVCAEWPTRLADVRSITSNTVALSAHESVAPIVEVVRGRTVALLGSSGAGKSTIANALLGESRQAPHPCGSPTRAAATRRHAACSSNCRTVAR